MKLVKKILKSHHTKKLLQIKEEELKQQFQRSAKQRSTKRYLKMQLEVGIQPEAEEFEIGFECPCCRYSNYEYISNFTLSKIYY